MKHEITAEELLKIEIIPHESLEDVFLSFKKHSEEYGISVSQPEVLMNDLLDKLDKAGYVIVKKREYLYADIIVDTSKKPT